MALKDFQQKVKVNGLVKASKDWYVWKFAPEKAWLQDCKTYYSGLNVKDAVVLDVGSDVGISPMYFLKHGAKTVIGYSLLKQKYKHPLYHSFEQPFTVDHALEQLGIYLHYFPHVRRILKSDCEGCEWTMTSSFINLFDDWIIGLHTPTQNIALYDYIKQSGQNIANPGGFLGDELTYTQDIKEFAIYRKKMSL